MKIEVLFGSLCVLFISGIVSAAVVSTDTFGAGANQFTIEFVDIMGSAASANGTNISSWSPGHPIYKAFNDCSNNYRIGTYEITNDQYSKFASNSNVYFTGADVPSNYVSWFEAARFVNSLNTSTGNQAAYKFTEAGEFAVWEKGDTGYDAANPFRNRNAFYFLPTEDEWVKAAYWNGINLQTYATVGDVASTQGGWNIHDGAGPWNVGSGNEELNGTFDMMGNLWEWTESPSSSGDYLPYSTRGIRGCSYVIDHSNPSSSYRVYSIPGQEHIFLGFRVASVIPEPCSLMLLGLGGLLLRRRRL